MEGTFSKFANDKKPGNCSQCYLYQISIFLCSHTLSIHIPVPIFSELSPSYVHLFPFSNLCLSQCICWIQTPPQPFFTHFYPHLSPYSTKALPLPNYHIKLCLLASVSHCCVRTYPFPSLHSFSSDFVSTFHLLFCSPSQVYRELYASFCIFLPTIPTSSLFSLNFPLFLTAVNG